MRNAFAKQITELAQQDPRVVLMAGDIGNRLFDKLKAQCPDRFFNCGVAEANMIGMAAGMAMSGLRPFCYTITPFITYRCLEQIRIDVCYHHAPVVIVGTGAGLSYASLGATHHSCEEMGMLRLIPGLAVLAPADEMEVRGAIKAALQYPHPVYIRIGKKGEPVVHQTEPEFIIGKSIPVRGGADVCLLSAGTMLPVALEAAEKLAQQGLQARVESFHTIKPLDETLLAEVFAKFKIVATLEEHSVLGGLGGAVAEWLANSGARGRLLRFGTKDEFLHETGEQEQAREFFGLTGEAIAARIAHAHRG
ncbi:MAG TPA: transketolase C-terminal domain-containing protein [Verrucomicrobiae bacterium]|jgi:transketolase|nr:transketolase C-terminal domain-containing protein [Verrucomicrobiae bacterium]